MSVDKHRCAFGEMAINKKQHVVTVITSVWILGALVIGICIFPVGPKGPDLANAQT